MDNCGHFTYYLTKHGLLNDNLPTFSCPRSVNEGLSGNWLETSGNLPRRFPASFRQVSGFFLAELFFFKNDYSQKNPGNLPETAAAGFRRFPEVSG